MEQPQIEDTESELKSAKATHYAVCLVCKQGEAITQEQPTEWRDKHSFHGEYHIVDVATFLKMMEDQDYTQAIDLAKILPTTKSLDGREPPMGAPGIENGLRVHRQLRQPMRAPIPIEQKWEGEHTSLPQHRPIEVVLSNEMIEARIYEIERVVRPLNEEVRCLKRILEVRAIEQEKTLANPETSGP